MGSGYCVVVIFVERRLEVGDGVETVVMVW